MENLEILEEQQRNIENELCSQLQSTRVVESVELTPQSLTRENERNTRISGAWSWKKDARKSSHSRKEYQGTKMG